MAKRQWQDLPVQKRVDWWVTRIGISAGLAAAAPRFAGALANRIPLQSAGGVGVRARRVRHSA